MFTASLEKYAKPLYKKLDPDNLTSYMLFRDQCTFYQGMFVKNLNRLNRPLSDIIIVDNSPHAFFFHPENALPCITWYNDKNDT